MKDALLANKKTRYNEVTLAKEVVVITWRLQKSDPSTCAEPQAILSWATWQRLSRPSPIPADQKMLRRVYRQCKQWSEGNNSSLTNRKEAGVYCSALCAGNPEQQKNLLDLQQRI